MAFGIHCNKLFQDKSSFPKLSVKTSCEKLSGVILSYSYRLHLVLVIRIYSDKNSIYPETQAARILVKQKIILICFQFTEYVQYQVLHQTQQQI